MNEHDAEVAAEIWLRAQGYVTRRTVRTKWHKVDFFGADVMGKREDGMAWVQVTTSDGNRAVEQVRRRRRKLETIPWSEVDEVYVLQVREQPNVENPRRKDHFFRVHQYFARGAGRARAWEVQKRLVPI